MSPPSDSTDEPGLFDDLPLYDGDDIDSGAHDSGSTASAPARAAARKDEAENLFAGLGDRKTSERPARSTPKQKQVSPTQVSLPESKPRSKRPDTETRPVWKPTVTLGRRVFAGLLDLAVNLVVLAVVGLGLSLSGIRLGPEVYVPLLVFSLSFSFLYFVFPLAFWGRTPGMARSAIVTRSRDGQSLSFAQAARRWLGAVLTLITLGTPLLFAGRNGDLLADRISGSQTFPAK